MNKLKSVFETHLPVIVAHSSTMAIFGELDIVFDRVSGGEIVDPEQLMYICWEVYKRNREKLEPKTFLEIRPLDLDKLLDPKVSSLLYQSFL